MVVSEIKEATCATYATLLECLLRATAEPEYLVAFFSLPLFSLSRSCCTLCLASPVEHSAVRLQENQADLTLVSRHFAASCFEMILQVRLFSSLRQSRGSIHRQIARMPITSHPTSVPSSTCQLRASGHFSLLLK